MSNKRCPTLLLRQKFPSSTIKKRHIKRLEIIAVKHLCHVYALWNFLESYQKKSSELSRNAAAPSQLKASPINRRKSTGYGGSNCLLQACIVLALTHQLMMNTNHNKSNNNNSDMATVKWAIYWDLLQFVVIVVVVAAVAAWNLSLFVITICAVDKRLFAVAKGIRCTVTWRHSQAEEKKIKDSGNERAPQWQTT